MIPALPTLSPALLSPTLAPPRPAAFPLDRLDDGGRARLYYLARTGLYHGLRALGLGAGDTVLLPAYHHGVEVEAVRATGAAVEFYRVDRALRADLDHAARLARRPRARALYLTHFAGFAQPIDDALALARDRGLLLIEDCALALLSRDPTGRPLGSAGDLAIFCLYKTLPVPHGGVALASAPLPRLAAPPLASTLHHLAGSLLQRAEASAGAPGRLLRAAARRTARTLFDPLVPLAQVGTSALRPRDLELGASALLAPLLRRIDTRLVAVRRRRNYTRLLELLGDARRVPTGPLPPGAVPLFLPLEVDDRRAALAALAARGIEAIDFWSVGHPACDEGRHPEVRALRRRVIEIPIHQDLDDEAVDRVAAALREVC
jgi:dTDP-4-amino-4,6-dideoxygalactose transaminase